jgi:SAM-dependent methyltransferase
VRKSFLSRLARRSRRPVEGPVTSAEFWTTHNVTLHRQFATREESLNYLAWRNAQYLFYDELLPVRGHDGEVVLDYGCGPGNDVVGFVEYSQPARVIGMEVSPSSLEEARRRLALHDDAVVELQLIHDGQPTLPLETASVDYVHSSGVLHHTANLGEILAEFHRILRPGGRAGIMVYNYWSLWLHLYVAYKRRLVDGIDADLPLADAFRRSTDGPHCPISRCYTPEQFLGECARAGLVGTFKGAAVSLHELSLLPLRLDALRDERLPGEHRQFLLGLTFDEHGLPRHRGEVAGIDAVFELRRR